ncbi:hypothetical protein XELAEV_18026033mg, partial [Xenopus laevis]
QLLSWSRWDSHTVWGQSENEQISGTHLNSYIWSSNRPPISVSNFLRSTQHTLRVWNTLKHRFRLTSAYSLNTIYLNNADFYPGTLREFCSRWQKTALHMIKDLLSPANSILTFGEISQKAPLVQLQLFEYFQLRHFLLPYIRQAESSAPLPFELLARSGLPQKGLISRIYKLLMDAPPDVHSEPSMFLISG